MSAPVKLTWVGEPAETVELISMLLMAFWAPALAANRVANTAALVKNVVVMAAGWANLSVRLCVSIRMSRRRLS